MNAASMPARLFVSRVEGFTYKPGWTFEPKVCNDGRLFVDLAVEFDSAYRPGRVTVTRRLVAPPPDQLIDVEAFRDWLHARLVDIESHEAKEWMRLDGDRLFALHPELVGA